MTEPRKKRGLSIRDINRDASFGGQYQPVPTFEKPAQPIVPAHEPAKPKNDEGSKTVEAKKVPELEDVKPVGEGNRAAPKHDEQSPVIPPKADGAKSQPGEVRNVSFNLYPKESHKADLDALATGKISVTDIVRVAGRATMAAFEPNSNFVEAEDVKRLGAAYRYRTSKNVEVNVLNALHEENNPLSLHSDFTMIRGQIEPLFWAKLDEVVKKLKVQKKGKAD